jgi:hypothetical protein
MIRIYQCPVKQDQTLIYSRTQHPIGVDFGKATAGIGTNVSNDSNNLLNCKRRRHNKDVTCSMSSLDSGKGPTMLTPKLSYHPMQPLHLNVKIKKTPTKKRRRLKMNIHNPNKHFFLPDSITPADAQRISDKTIMGDCDREWECGGKSESSDGLISIPMTCMTAFMVEVSYFEKDNGTVSGLTIAAHPTTWIERNQMGLDASVTLDTQNAPSLDSCSFQECTWANINMPTAAVNFR